MPSRTAFLGRLVGLYLVLLALTMFVNRDLMVTAVDAFPRDPAALALAGVLALGAGLGIVLTHNVWSSGALAVVVTLSGWAALIKGLILLSLSPQAVQAYITSLHYGEFFYAYAGIALVLGAYLTYGGFSHREA